MGGAAEPLEGVVRFRALHRDAALRAAWGAHGGEARALAPLLKTLALWRDELLGADLLGQDPARYGGAGFGNLSFRLPGAAGGAGAFVITGTQTSGLGPLAPAHLAPHLSLVLEVDLRANAARSVGPARPSSEAMTHAALYAASPLVMWVFHGHSAPLWGSAELLGLPVTPAEVGYGTPEMAAAVAGLWGGGACGLGEVLVMGGHEGGVICAGREAREAGEGLLGALRALGARP
jgi:hypothetical protein